MTVGELERELSDYPKDMKIFLASDPEGNGFHALWSAEKEYVVGDDLWIEVVHPEDAAKLNINDMAIVLWP